VCLFVTLCAGMFVCGVCLFIFVCGVRVCCLRVCGYDTEFHQREIVTCGVETDRHLFGLVLNL